MKAKILALKPTQFAVGMDEVEFRVKEMKRMKPVQLHDYLHAHKIPVVRGPGGLYLIDKHHLVRACWEMGLTHVPVNIVGDLSKSKNFQCDMEDANWVYLTDQFGNADHSINELPVNVRGLADNDWRSLAWKVRVEGGFDKVHVPFSEFKWAEFFRKKLSSKGGSTDVQAALKLCKSPAAKHLPGHKRGK